uniref:Uncharacterized protein n=1 Tax=Oryza brachyantha TaxID=4533 RepID=J3LBV8_ORYBR
MPPVAIYLYIHIFILLVHRCLSAAAYAPASPPSASPPAQPVRVYREGVEVFFDRETEVRTFECMSRHGHGPRLPGHGPRLLGRFPNGRVEEFIHTRHPKIYRPAVARCAQVTDRARPTPGDVRRDRGRPRATKARGGGGGGQRRPRGRS